MLLFHLRTAPGAKGLETVLFSRIPTAFNNTENQHRRAKHQHIGCNGFAELSGKCSDKTSADTGADSICDSSHSHISGLPNQNLIFLSKSFATTTKMMRLAADCRAFAGV